MKKIFLFLLLSLFSLNVFAQNPSGFAPGIYVGVQGGIAYDGLPNHNLSGINFGGRAFAGYNFTENFALEAGFLATDNKEVKDRLNGNTEKLKLRQQILDAAIRINAPLGDNFIVYAKGGMACLDYFEKGNVSKIFNMTYGLGLDYKITNKLSAGFMWSHYNGGSKKPIDIIYKKYQPSLDFYALSLAYTF